MKVFVDTTTLLYTLDANNPGKQALSREWLRTLQLTGRLRLSLQVLAEAYSVVRRKPAFAASRPMVRAYLTDHAPWLTRPVTIETAAQAWGFEDRFGIGWWDALLLASAAEAHCPIFLSEDLADGQRYGGVLVVDPFAHEMAAILAPQL